MHIGEINDAVAAGENGGAGRAAGADLGVCDIRREVGADGVDPRADAAHVVFAPAGEIHGIAVEAHLAALIAGKYDAVEIRALGADDVMIHGLGYGLGIHRAAVFNVEGGAQRIGADGAHVRAV